MAILLDCYEFVNRIVSDIYPKSLKSENNCSVKLNNNLFRELPCGLSSAELRAIKDDIIWSNQLYLVQKRFKNIRWITFPTV